MTTFLFNARKNVDDERPHVDVDVFAGPDADHRAHVGRLTMTTAEWRSMKNARCLGSPRFESKDDADD